MILLLLFFCFFWQNPPPYWDQFIMPNLVNIRSFIGIRSKLVQISDYKLAEFFQKKCMCSPPPPDMHFKSFRPHIFTNIQRFLMKLRMPTKVGGKIAQWSLFFTWMERKEMAKEWHRLKGPLGRGHFWSLGGDGGNSKDQKAAPLVVVNQLKPMSRFIGKVLKSSSYPHHPKRNDKGNYLGIKYLAPLC